jgi:hypothetical protein
MKWLRHAVASKSTIFWMALSARWRRATSTHADPRARRSSLIDTSPRRASPAFLKPELEDYEPTQLTETVKPPEPVTTTPPHLVGIGTGRLPASRRPEYLNHLAQEDPPEWPGPGRRVGVAKRPM